MSKRKNVFISHHSADDEHIQNFKKLLDGKGYTIKNSSVDSSKPNRATDEAYIKRLLRMRINWAKTFICLIGKDTHSRQYVDYEIKCAHKQGKRIVGVYISGGKDSDIPASLEKYGHGTTGWNSDKIIRALEGEDIGWCDSEGQPREPKYRITRIACQ